MEEYSRGGGGINGGVELRGTKQEQEQKKTNLKLKNRIPSVIRNVWNCEGEELFTKQ